MKRYRADLDSTNANQVRVATAKSGEEREWAELAETFAEWLAREQEAAIKGWTLAFKVGRQ